MLFDLIGIFVFIGSMTAILVALVYGGTVSSWSAWRIFTPLVTGVSLSHPMRTSPNFQESNNLSSSLHDVHYISGIAASMLLLATVFSGSARDFTYAHGR